MGILYLSRHVPSDKMLAHLSEKFPGMELTQVSGTTSNFSGNKMGTITMTETTLSGIIKREFNGIEVVVAVLPPHLLSELLRVAKTVLRPLTTRKPTGKKLPNGDDEVSFEYTGLERVIRVTIETELFAGEKVDEATRQASREACQRGQ